MCLNNILIDGSKEAKNILIFAHGAGAPMDSVFMSTIAKGMANKNLMIIRFEFNYMHKRREGIKTFPDNIHKLCIFYESFINKIKNMFPNKKIWLAGKSMGGRVSAIISKKINVSGVIIFGYPFHPIKRIDKLRLDCLQEAGPSILIIQGKRDKLGNYEEVQNYNLNKNNFIYWIDDGDHSFNTLKSSIKNSSDSVKEAYLKALNFIKY